MSEILIIDDDRFLADTVSRLLGSAGFQVRKAHTASDGYLLASQKQPDLLILDLSLPDQDGVSLCRRIRSQWKFPILMLTSRTDTMDKVVGLEVGADDYLTKPFEGKELLARVRAQLRRYSEYQPQPTEEVIECGPLRIDMSARAVDVNERKIEVTETEFKILAYLGANRGRAISREQMFESVWGYDLEFSTNSLEVLIYRLRQKLEDASCPNLIHTMRGYGYKMELCDQDSSFVQER